MMQDPPRLLDDASVPTEVGRTKGGMNTKPPMPEKLLARPGRRIAFMAAFPVFMASVFKTKGSTTSRPGPCRTAPGQPPCVMTPTGSL